MEDPGHLFDDLNKEGTEENQIHGRLTNPFTVHVTDILSNLRLHEHTSTSRRAGLDTCCRGRRKARKRHIAGSKISQDGNRTERLFRAVEKNVFRQSTRKGKGKPECGTQEKPPRAMSYSTMCIRDSNSLQEECPESFGNVDTQWYILADAMKLADQLNTTLPKLPEKGIFMSKDQRIPVKNKTDGLLYFEKDTVHDIGSKEEEEEEEKFLFDFSKNTKSLSNIYERVEVTGQQKEQEDVLRQKYMDILEELNKGIEFQKHPRPLDTSHGGDAQGVESKHHGVETINHKEEERLPCLYPNAVRIFAVEHLKDKEKNKYTFKFHTCSLSAAWKVHLENDPSNLHWYEVLREDFPCHLYFDLEYPKENNRNEHIDGDGMVDALIEVTKSRLKEDFDLSMCDKDIYELDSTSAQKFSRHLIIKIPGYAFSNNIAVGEFVAQICADSGSSLLVQNKDGSLAYFVDTAVYTKNRLFRLVYNCKGGKAANFMPTNRFAMSRTPRPTPAAVFKETLLTSVDDTVTLLMVRPRISMTLRGQNPQMHIPALERRGIKRDNENDFIPNKCAMAKLDHIARTAIPTIEAYATKRANQPASVRNYQLCGGFGTVAYNLTGNGAHYCSNVGRDHESNYVYIVANFFTLRMAQKCHDRDCYKYKSPSTEMPEKYRWDPNENESTD